VYSLFIAHQKEPFMKLYQPYKRGFILVMCSLLLIAVVTACNSPSQRVTVPYNKAAIRLTGNAVGAKLIIDDEISFSVVGENQNMTFNVLPGTHRIRVEKNGIAVVDQKVLVNRSQTLELLVP
jgi:hypothetical protein